MSPSSRRGLARFVQRIFWAPFLGVDRDFGPGLGAAVTVGASPGPVFIMFCFDLGELTWIDPAPSGPQPIKDADTVSRLTTSAVRNSVTCLRDDNMILQHPFQISLISQINGTSH